jgi:hypothetical protein
LLSSRAPRNHARRQAEPTDAMCRGAMDVSFRK